MATNMVGDPAGAPYGDRTVEEWMNASGLERGEIANDIVRRIDLGVLTVGEVVRDLEPYVVGEDLLQTADALRLMVSLLNSIQVPMDRINVHVLVEYFCTRLNYKGDILNYRAGIKETAEALLALASMPEKKSFPVGDAAIIAQAVFAVPKHGHLHGQINTTRFALLQLLDFLMATYKPNLLRNIGANEFVQGVVAMAELEKDPSCLKIIFGMYINLGRHWELDQETLLLIWGSFIRYYPITLSTPSKDPLVPTPQELKSLLLSCIVSNDYYAKEAFRYLIDDKLDEDVSATVKTTLLDTIASCVTGYSPDATLEWAPKIWASLKFEIWNGEVDEFITGSLRVIQALASAISSHNLEWDDEEHPAARFLLEVLRECIDRAVDRHRTFMSSTGRILSTIASVSPYTFSWVVKKTLPGLLNAWDDSNEKSEQTSVLTVLNGILKARVEVGQQLEANLLESSPQSPTSHNYLGRSQAALRSALANFKERLVEQVYWKAMTGTASHEDTKFRIHTIQGLVLLTRIPDFLLDFEQGTIISSLNKISLDFTQPFNMREGAVSALQQVSINDPFRFSTITLPNFLSRLPESMSTADLAIEAVDQEIDNILYILDSLGRIACSQPCGVVDTNTAANFPSHTVFEAFQNSMLQKFFEVLGSDGQVVYAQCIAIAIFKGLKMFDDSLNISESEKNLENHPYSWIVITLYSKLAKFNAIDGTVDVVLSPANSEPVERLIGYVGQIATLALRSSQTTASNNFLNAGADTKPSQVWSLFVLEALECIDLSQMDLSNSSAGKHLANTLSMALVAGVGREEVARLRFNVPQVALAMIKNATTEIGLSPLGRVGILQFLQLLVNKFGVSSLQDNQDPSLVDYIKERIKAASNDEETTKVYQTLMYFTAASLHRCDPFGQTLVDLMIEGILHPTLGSRVARCFRLLLAPSEILTKENFCLVRPLRYGRLYNFAIDQLEKIWRSSHDYEIKTNALIAIAGVLEHMEESVYIDNASSILPLLLEGTNVQGDDSAKLACIKIINILILNSPDLILPHLDSVINRMTDRTRNTYYSPSDSNAECRSAAIDVLSTLATKIDAATLLKRKPKVLSELDGALDDCSSVVRLRAQVCNLKWFGLGSA